MTKEELVGRKFVCDNSTTVYTILNGTGNTLSFQFLYKGNSDFIQKNSYTVDEFNAKLTQNWKLLPEEPITYTTPKGIKYGVGIKFITTTLDKIREIVKLQDNYCVIKYCDKNYTYTTSIKGFGDLLDMWNYKALAQDTLNNNQMPKFKAGDTLVSNGLEKYCTKTTKVGEVTSDGYMLVGNTQPDTFEWVEKHYNLKEMNEVIEVGDIIDGISFTNNIVVRIEENQYWVTNQGEIDRGFPKPFIVSFRHAKLVSKANKQEVIGYELLKDLPGIPAGTKSTAYASDGTYSFTNAPNNSRFNKNQLQDTTWFKPIYKAKEVVVKISSGREVIITNNSIKMTGGSFDFFHFKAVRDFVINGSLIVNGFTTTHSSVKVGCQEFTKEDIELVYKAIQDFK